MKFSQLILNWFHQFGRKNLPWQIKKNLYTIWISEIMLQQTKVQTVIPYFNKFIKRFPTIKKLSESSLDDIMYIWSGLGYYIRAKNLHNTAKIIAKKHNGIFPDNFNIIKNFPGIGKTTAGAILSFSLGSCFSILDGNVKRILLRFYLINNNINYYKLEKKLWKIIESITPIYNTDKFNQAMMDIGSLICTFNKPKCTICPLNRQCLSNQNKIFLVKIKKKVMKKTFWSIIIQFNNTVLLTKCNKDKLWNSLFIFPIFKEKIKIINWCEQNGLNYKKGKKLNSINCKISNYSLLLKIKIFEIFSKKMIQQKKINMWYNLLEPQPIGIPKPMNYILSQLKINE